MHGQTWLMILVKVFGEHIHAPRDHNSVNDNGKQEGLLFPSQNRG